MHERMFDSKVVRIMKDSNDISICIIFCVTSFTLIAGCGVECNVLTIYRGMANLGGVNHYGHEKSEKRPRVVERLQ
jgi:hypothetical protein